MQLKKLAVAGVKITSAATIVTIGAQFFRIVILTRFLDKSDFGLVAIVSVVLGFTNLFSDLGFTAALMHRQDVTKREFSSIYWLNGGVNFLLFIILIALSPFIAKWYAEPILVKLIPLMALQLIIVSIGKLYAVQMQKEMKFFLISVRDIIGAFVSIVVAYFTAFYGMGVYSIVIATLSNVLIVNLLNFFNEYKKLPVSLHFTFSEAKGFLKIGIFQTGAQMLNFFSSKLDIILISRFFGTDDLGVYSLAKELVLKPIAIINKIVNNVSLPLFSKVQSDDVYLKKIYSIVIKGLTLFTFPILALFYACSSQIVTLFYGANFKDVIPLFEILIFWSLVNAVGNPSSALSIAKGKTNLNFYWTLVQIVFSTVIIVISSYYSIVAVAYGQDIIALIAYYVYWKFVISKLIPLSFKEYFILILPTFLIALISLGFTKLVMMLFTTEPYFVGLIVNGSILFSIYISLSWLFNRETFYLVKSLKK